MPFILFDSLLPAIAWTFIHSLWQGLILTILTGLVLLHTRHATAARRYALLLGLFLLFTCGVVITFFIVWNTSSKPIAGVDTGFYLQTPFTIILSFRQWLEAATAFLNTNAVWIVLGWFIVFIFKCGRMIQEMGQIKSLRTNAIQESPEQWSDKVQSLAQGLRITKPVRLLQSCLVKIPVTVGYLKPLILVPVGMLNNMPPAQVEAVLLHELAHIRRHDYLVNFIQRMEESVFFFNPALLWVSSLLRAERESCCDELAIACTGNKLGFVEALIYCKESSMRTSFAIGFLGQKNLLLHRLNRIVSNRNKRLSYFELAFFSFSLLFLIALVSAVNAEKASRNLVVSDIKPTVQQVDISEVQVSLTKPDASLPLPPPPAVNQIIREVNRAPGSGTTGDRVEIDLTRSGKPEFIQVDKDRVEAERKGAKRILVNELKNPE